MIKCRSYSIRLISWIVLVSIIGSVIGIMICSMIEESTDRRDIWWTSVFTTIACFSLLIITVCVILGSYMKNKEYYINYNERWIKNGDKIIHYHLNDLKISRHSFGLVTIKVNNAYGKMVLKDVPNKVREYIEKSE